jgi:D-alanyl-D-alanine carboxypeptidase
MKKWSLLIVYIVFAVSSIFAESRWTVYYILPQGLPYSSPDFYVKTDQNVLLHFGDELTVIEKIIIDGVKWYRCNRGLYYFYLPEMHVTRRSVAFQTVQNRNIAIGSGIIDREHPIPLDYKPDDLIRILPSYKAYGYEWRELLLRRKAARVFERLIDSARRDGVSIGILSAYRDAAYQSRLYSNAIRRHGIYQIRVAKPGHSEHQLGTVCDLTSDEVNSGLTREFENTVAFQWLMENISDYGIILSYPKSRIRITGYIYEPWHFRYIGDMLQSSEKRKKSYLLDH